MDLATAYRTIWSGKLRDIEIPEKQSIERVTQTAELWREHFAGRLTGPLLDAGCGSGAMLAKAKESGIHATGVDFDSELLAWIESLGWDVSACDLNTEKLPGADYQIAVACDVLEHLIDPAHLLAEMHRVLAPEGLALASTPNCSYWKRVKQLAEGEMFRTSGDDVLKDGGHLGFWGPTDLLAAMRKAGFRECVIHYRNPSPVPPGQNHGAWSGFAYLIAQGVK